MSKTVQSQLLKLALAVDPLTKAGVTFTAGTVCTVDGDKFAPQELLDIYNLARMSMLSAMRELMGDEATGYRAGANLQRTLTLAFAADAGVPPSMFATLPAGFVYPLTLRDVSGNVISVLNSRLLPMIKRHESATVRFVFVEGNLMRSIPGSTVITASADYQFWYYGLSDFVLADVTGGVTVETFQDADSYKLVQIAQYIALEQGNVQPLAFAKSLLAGERNAT